MLIGLLITIPSMILYFKHIIHIDYFPLERYTAYSLYNLNEAPLDIRVPGIDDEDGVGENASRHFKYKWRTTYHIMYNAAHVE